MDLQRIFKRLPVTCTLIILNIVVYALQFLIPHQWIFLQGAYNPLVTEVYGQWWRLFTSGFIHDPNNVAHLGMNMLTLYLFGQTIEPLMNRWQYLMLYCLSILGGSAMIWAVAYFNNDLNVTTVGASGGVFGLFGAYFSIAKLTRQSTTPILILVAVNFIYGFMMGNVSWEAHLGGLLTGALLTFIFGRRVKQQILGHQPAHNQASETNRQIPSAYDQYRNM